MQDTLFSRIADDSMDLVLPSVRDAFFDGARSMMYHYHEGDAKEWLLSTVADKDLTIKKADFLMRFLPPIIPIAFLRESDDFDFDATAYRKLVEYNYRRFLPTDLLALGHLFASTDIHVDACYLVKAIASSPHGTFHSGVLKYHHVKTYLSVSDASIGTAQLSASFAANPIFSFKPNAGQVLLLGVVLPRSRSIVLASNPGKGNMTLQCPGVQAMDSVYFIAITKCESMLPDKSCSCV